MPLANDQLCELAVPRKSWRRIDSEEMAKEKTEWTNATRKLVHKTTRTEYKKRKFKHHWQVIERFQRLLVFDRNSEIEQHILGQEELISSAFWTLKGIRLKKMFGIKRLVVTSCIAQ